MTIWAGASGRGRDHPSADAAFSGDVLSRKATSKGWGGTHFGSGFFSRVDPPPLATLDFEHIFKYAPPTFSHLLFGVEKLKNRTRFLAKAGYFEIVGGFST